MGGVVEFKKNLEKWEFITQHLINGQFKNVRSKNDRILYLYSLSELSVSAGRNNLELGHCQNFDLSKLPSGMKLGHMDYMKETVLQEVLQTIDLK